MTRRWVPTVLATFLTLGGVLAALLWPDRPSPLAPEEAGWVDAATLTLGLPPEASGDLAPLLLPALQRARAVDDSARRASLLEHEIARLSVAVVQASDGPIPALDPAPVCLRTLGGSSPEAFVEALGPSDVAEVGTPLMPSCALAVVAVDSTVPLLASQGSAVRALASGDTPTVVVALGSPSVAEGLPKTDAFIATHSVHPAALRAAADAIRGRIAVTGRLRSGGSEYRAGDGIDLPQHALRADSPEAAGLAPDVADAVDAVIARGLADGAFPGAAVAIGRGGVLVRLQGYGGLTDGGEPVTPDTPYDLASLTKVVATTTLTMRAVERGDLDLDAPVRDLVPSFQPIGGEAITPRHLLSHTAGHRPFWPFFYYGMTPEAAREFIHADTLQRVPGERVVYSDFDMIVLGEALEAASGEDLETLTKREVTGPLGMSATGFRPVGSRDLSAAPTERDTLWRQRLLQGEVHDEAASLFGGVSGHAGLFSTARDMARFGFTLANGGDGYGHRLASGETLEQFTTRVRTPGSHAMGLGWMLAPRGRGRTEPMGREMGPRTFGHTGFTGTSIWIDPDEELFIVLLTNRIYPTRERSGIRQVRARLADAVASRIVAPVR